MSQGDDAASKTAKEGSTPSTGAMTNKLIWRRLNTTRHTTSAEVCDSRNPNIIYDRMSPDESWEEFDKRAGRMILREYYGYYVKWPGAV